MLSWNQRHCSAVSTTPHVLATLISTLDRSSAARSASLSPERSKVLDDEVAIMEKYVTLLRLRFGEALKMNLHLNGHSPQDFLIPPISAFVALENAIKHNEIAEQTPLEININIVGSMLSIRNKVQPKRSLQHSSHIGLANLEERFRIITGKGIQVTRENGCFQVDLPLTRIAN
jgi:LytS/YehU family sensor histidine kinase